jgi:hypothetical protein
MTPDLWGDGNTSPAAHWSEEKTNLRRRQFEVGY